MPFIDIATNTSTSPKIRQKLLDDVVALVEKHLDKPKDVTMARLSTDDAMSFKGSAEPTAYVLIRAIGLPDRERRAEVVAAVSGLLDEVLDIPVARTFVAFDEVRADCWGARGTLVG